MTHHGFKLLRIEFKIVCPIVLLRRLGSILEFIAILIANYANICMDY